MLAISITPSYVGASCARDFYYTILCRSELCSRFLLHHLFVGARVFAYKKSTETGRNVQANTPSKNGVSRARDVYYVP